MKHNIGPHYGVDVLHVSYTFWPDPVGGTEVYVRDLVTELGTAGISSAIAAPGERATHTNLYPSISRWVPNTEFPGAAVGLPDPDSALAFRSILAELRPRIVHLHARTAAVSSMLLEEAHAFGARTVVTYHSPTMSCPRGTMMYRGDVPCDGHLDDDRCTRCVMQSHGLPDVAAGFLSLIPAGLGRLLVQAGLKGKPATAMLLRERISKRNRDFSAFVANSDQVVAVCEWVADVLRNNGVPAEKLKLIRQGHCRTLDNAASIEPGAARERSSSGAPLRIASFGRVDRAKGYHLVAQAIAGIDNATYDLYGVNQKNTSAYAGELSRLSQRIPRFRIHPPVTESDVVATMMRYDVVAVPSTWLETGPLVVLEAFAAGRPVVGTRRGGIAELVSHGIDGLLVDSSTVSAWQDVFSRLSGDPALVDDLRRGIKPPRSMAQAAHEMMQVYSDLDDAIKERIKAHVDEAQDSANVTPQLSS